MRRFLTDFNANDLEIIDTDLLIVGSGIAGLFAGLHVPSSMNAIVITKVNIESSNSWLAQGGIAAVMSSDDNEESHIDDTLRAGAGLCDLEAVKVLVHEGPVAIRELIALDVPFDTNPEGELQITREGGHSCRRIVHCGGDATGRETTRRLGQIALERKNLSFMFGTYLVDILTDGDSVIGALVFDRCMKIIRTPNIIIASGGIGSVYRYTTNPRGAVGDGIACAKRAGAVIDSMEMVQFHPTTLISEDVSDRLFLISEAVRGEGGILRNHEGVAFMKGQHPMADLAPRDIVTRCILKELRRSGKTNVFLDVTSMTREFFAGRFPTIFGRCRELGINLTQDPIPVRPAQHYLMGGIKTDIDGMTNIKGLYSCGESACTGIHGGNRLASNSMLECLVFSKRAIAHIVGENRSIPSLSLLRSAGFCGNSGLPVIDGSETEAIRSSLRCEMSDYVGAIRRRSELLKSKADFEALENRLAASDLRDVRDFELYSMTEVALMVTDSALARRESIGAHYIEEE